VKFEEKEGGLLPPSPKHKKPWVVLYRVVGGAPRSWHNWKTWKKYRDLKKAQQAVNALNLKHVGETGWHWEFKLAP